MNTNPVEAVRHQLVLLHAAADLCHMDQHRLPGLLSERGLGIMAGIGRLHPIAPQLVAAARSAGHTAGHHFAAEAIVNIAQATQAELYRPSLETARQYTLRNRAPLAWLRAVGMMHAPEGIRLPAAAATLMHKGTGRRHSNLEHIWRAWVVAGAADIAKPDDIMAMLRYAPESAGVQQVSSDPKQEQRIRHYLRQLDSHDELPVMRETLIAAAGASEPYPENPTYDHGTPEAYARYLRGLGLERIAGLIAGAGNI